MYYLRYKYVESKFNCWKRVERDAIVLFIHRTEYALNILLKNHWENNAWNILSFLSGGNRTKW